MTEAELSLGSHRRPYWRPGYYLFVFVLVLADLLSKDWAWQFWNLGPQQVFGDWLSWQTLTNPGGVFGLWRGLTLPLTIVRIFAVGLLFWLLGRQARANWKGSATLSLLWQAPLATFTTTCRLGCPGKEMERFETLFALTLVFNQTGGPTFCRGCFTPGPSLIWQTLIFRLLSSF